MSGLIQKQGSLLLIIPGIIGTVLVLIGVIGIFSSDNNFDQLLSGFMIIPGSFILFYSFREFKHRREGKFITKHDERSEVNRLKAADGAFRFYFVTLALLILLNALDVIDEIVFVAMTGPIIAAGVTSYYLGYFWFERRG